MLEYFSKIDYKLNGQTLEFTDLFKSINLNTDGFNNYSQIKNSLGQRPDQLANSIYGDSSLYWSLFLMNGIKNPFTQWKKSSISNKAQKDTEYACKVFQFANTSTYLPGNTLYFEENSTDSYHGISFGNIEINDIITFETGSGAFNLHAFGAGQIVASTSCGHPHYGQSLIPDNFLYKNNTYKIAAGEYFSAVIDTLGRIWGWGTINSLNGFDVSDRLYKSQDSGYTLINITKNKIIASKSDNKWYCYGSGCTTGIAYPVSENKTISKIEFTKGNTFSGIVLFSDNTVKTYGGLTHCSTYTGIKDISCAENWCLGINSGNTLIEFNYTGTAQGIASSFTTTDIQKLACGISHAVVLNSYGVLYSAGDNSMGQLDIGGYGFNFSEISAGRYHTAGIDYENTIVISGVIQNDSGVCTGSTGYVQPAVPYGKYEAIVSGNDHILCLETGTNKKYIGRVEIIDEEFKRIYIKGFSGPSSEVLIDDPTGTIVTFFTSSGKNIKKTIQHQLLSIDSYGNTPIYVLSDDGYSVLDLVENNAYNWKNIYIVSYKDASTLAPFITPNKLDIDILNTDIKFINNEKIYLLRDTLKGLLKTQNKINIKMSNL